MALLRTQMPQDRRPRRTQVRSPSAPASADNSRARSQDMASVGIAGRRD